MRRMRRAGGRRCRMTSILEATRPREFLALHFFKCRLPGIFLPVEQRYRSFVQKQLALRRPMVKKSNIKVEQ